ncbi:UNVERIFIED_CONTAM: hypothetical protein RF648_13065 [Kocuria sp. CPCC 205274]
MTDVRARTSCAARPEAGAAVPPRPAGPSVPPGRTKEQRPLW